MTKRTRLFFFVTVGILVAGLGTGAVASYMGIQNLVLIGRDGPAELAYVPADARVVAFANVREVMDSELRQKLMQLNPGANEGPDKFREETGIDIRSDVDQVIASMSGEATTPENARPFVLVRGRFDNARIESLVRQQGGQASEYQGIRFLTHPENGFALAFVEPGLVAVGTATEVRRAIDTKANGNNVTGNAEVMRHVKDIDDGNAWVVGRFEALTGGKQLPAELAKQLPAISWFSASGTVNGGVRGVIRAEARDEAAANDLRDVVRGFIALARMQVGQRAEFAELMNSLELGGQGKDVSIGFAVPSELIDALSAMRALRPQQREAQPELEPNLKAWPAPAL
jgi:hypothetical protein